MWLVVVDDDELAAWPQNPQRLYQCLFAHPPGLFVQEEKDDRPVEAAVVKAEPASVLLMEGDGMHLVKLALQVGELDGKNIDDV